MSEAPALPAGVHLLERGWLSSNNIVLIGPDSTALVDSGYCTHTAQTLALVQGVLGERPLDQLANTHLHSDHCGGNAGLQDRYPLLQTLIPPGHAAQVQDWDATALSYAPTGQSCPRFSIDALLLPGQEVNLAGELWQVHAAAGHDPHSVILFHAPSRTLISADALWENGFGVVFPVLDGIEAFDDVAMTLDLIESLGARCVIPGHGRAFSDVDQALRYARRRLEGFAANPTKHGMYAAKVLLKFRLLELQQCELGELIQWALASAYFRTLHQLLGIDVSLSVWVDQLTNDLVTSKAAVRQGTRVVNL